MMHILYIALLACSLAACSQARNQQKENTTVSQAVPQTNTPVFDADSAYTYVETRSNSVRVYLIPRPIKTVAITWRPS